ncbi:MAG: hypothetical protein ACLFMX_02895 [Halobacteriales archaeon]
MVSPITLLIVANTVTLLLGGGITAMAMRAFRRTGTPALRALAVGIGLITVGTATGGALHQLFEMDLVAAILVQNLCITLGFAVLAYSLWLPIEVDRRLLPTRLE